MILLSSLVAQANNPDSINRRKWELGIFYFPSRMTPDFGDEILINYPIGFAIFLSKNTSENFSFETGLNYKHKRIEEIKFVYSLYPGEVSNYNEIHKINIFEIPVKIKYYPFKKSKFSFYFSGGITNSFYIRESICLVTGYPWSQYWKYYNLIVNLGIGGQYKINKNLGVIFEPSVGYFAAGGLQEFGVLELKTGITYHF
jgi:hypothetical protein